jgi:hypothetical protein
MPFPDLGKQIFCGGKQAFLLRQQQPGLVRRNGQRRVNSATRGQGCPPYEELRRNLFPDFDRFVIEHGLKRPT